jgi:hypothetical protein
MKQSKRLTIPQYKRMNISPLIIYPNNNEIRIYTYTYLPNWACGICDLRQVEQSDPHCAQQYIAERKFLCMSSMGTHSGIYRHIRTIKKKRT